MAEKTEEIPEEMKKMTWNLYVRATDINPGVCVTSTRLYYIHLKSMFKRFGITEFDKEMKRCDVIIGDAWRAYTENAWGDAFHKATFALGFISDIAYDDRFSSIDITAFKGMKKT